MARRKKATFTLPRQLPQKALRRTATEAYEQLIEACFFEDGMIDAIAAVVAGKEPAYGTYMDRNPKHIEWERKHSEVVNELCDYGSPLAKQVALAVAREVVRQLTPKKKKA